MKGTSTTMSELQEENIRLGQENFRLRRLIAEREQAEDHLRLIFNSVYDAIFVHTEDGTIVDVNDKMLNLYQVSREQALSFTIQDYSDICNPLADLPCIWSRVLTGESQFFTWKARRPLDGTAFDVEVFLKRMTLDEQFYILATVRDIGDRKRAEEALRLAQFSLDHATDSIFWIEPDGYFAYVNNAACQALGYRREELLGLSLSEIAPTFMGLVWQDYWNEVKQQGFRTFETYHRHRDGSSFPVEVTINYLESNTRAFLCAFARNITERKRAQAVLQDTNEQLRLRVHELEQRNREISLLNQMGARLHSCQSLDDVYRTSSSFLQELFKDQIGLLYLINGSGHLEPVVNWGYPALTMQDVVPSDCLAMQKVQDSPVTTVPNAIPCQCPVTHGATTFASCVPLVTGGESQGLLHLRSREPIDPAACERTERLALVVAGQIALAVANLRLRERLRAQSIRDPLTGLFNRRYLDETLKRELHEAARYHRSIGVVMLDIDYFKRFNDTYHHDAGDALLRTVGVLLQTHIRSEDIACRYGGEEFILVLPGASVEDTYRRTDELREQIKQLTIVHNSKILASITISAGVAVFPIHGMTRDTVIQAADRALYRAKAEGRDRVVVAELLSKS